MTLRRRVLLATVTVALIAVAATAFAALQLVRSADTAAARQQLAAQAERLAAATPATRTAIVDGLSLLADGDVLVSTVAVDGALTGSASGVVPPRVVVSLVAGRDVSTSARSGGQTYLIEGRPAVGGGAVVTVQASDRILGIGSSVWPRLLIALAIGLAVAVVAALILSRLLTRPLTRLATAARRMAAGERDVPLERTDVAEVGDVESALSALDAALARSEGRQREFLLSISHELRTPLTAIRGYAEALSDGVVPPGDVAQVGRTLVAESARLTAFTTDLLTLARLESDDFSLDVGDVDLREVVRSAADAWGAVASASNVTFDTDLPPERVRVCADAARLRQVLDGLLENALRVSPEGSRISMRARADGTGAEIVIADGGPGLTPEDAAEAFERGRLHDRYKSVRVVGTGLGLSIAARLVARMGGRITAHSVPAAGAEFRIHLPAGDCPQR